MGHTSTSSLSVAIIIESASCMGASDNRRDLFGASVYTCRRCSDNPDSAFAINVNYSMRYKDPGNLVLVLLPIHQTSSPCTEETPGQQECATIDVGCVRWA